VLAEHHCCRRASHGSPAGPVTLTPTEFRLLAALIRHPGQTLTPDQLLKLA
jgi:DNA-binding response OmpR family regulator